MKEKLYDATWSLGVEFQNMAKRIGFLGPFEQVLWKLGPRLIRPPSREIEIDLPFGMKAVVPPLHGGARSYSAGIFEKDLAKLFTGIVREGMTIVDLGANIGYYTLVGSRVVGPTGRVYAFEPDPRNCAYLVRNVSANGCANVVAVQKAVSTRTGQEAFVLQEPGAGGSLAATVPQNAPSIVVHTVSLDDFFGQEGWPAIDLVKMDIEGGEKAALEGMRELSKRNPALRLIMESNPGVMRHAGMRPEAIAGTLWDLGFRRGYIIERRLKPFSIASAFPRTRATYNLLLTKESNGSA